MNLLVRDAYFAPALNRIPSLDAYREGLDFSDTEFVVLGLRRINTLYPTGRAFLQSVRQCELTDVSFRAYYGAVSSQRRLQMLHELNGSVSQLATVSSDRFLKFPELAHYDVVALDAHDIESATHEPKATLADGRREVPDTTTGLFLRNLKNGAARVLAQTQGHQHEWSAVKNRPWAEFLWSVGARLTLMIIDAVAVDFGFLRAAKYAGRITVITRTKVNLVVRKSRDLDWNREDPRNSGVLSDQRVHYSEPGEFRVIRYQDPESDEIYEFLTTEFHLPPGIIAQLYRLRWDIEKFFDVCENLLAEKRAWGTGAVAAQVQNEFLVLAHNLLVILSSHLEAQEGIRDEKVEKKYEAALQVREAVAQKADRSVSPWVRALRRITRWSSQFTRWLQDAILRDWEWGFGVIKLRPLMTAYMR